MSHFVVVEDRSAVIVTGCAFSGQPWPLSMLTRVACTLFHKEEALCLLQQSCVQDLSLFWGLLLLAYYGITEGH